MSALNRIIASLTALAILALAIIVVLVATKAIGHDFLPVDWFDTVLKRIADAAGGKQAAIIAGGVVVALLMVGLLIAEVTPPRRSAVLRISSGEEGSVTVDRYSLSLLARTTAREVREVRDAECRVVDKEDGLWVTCRASVSFGSSFPDVTSELQAKVSEALGRLTGLNVVQVTVSTRYAKGDGGKVTVR